MIRTRRAALAQKSAPHLMRSGNRLSPRQTRRAFTRRSCSNKKAHIWRRRSRQAGRGSVVRPCRRRGCDSLQPSPISRMTPRLRPISALPLGALRIDRLRILLPECHNRAGVSGKPSEVSSRLGDKGLYCLSARPHLRRNLGKVCFSILVLRAGYSIFPFPQAW
jgi:hypothetical protein